MAEATHPTGFVLFGRCLRDPSEAGSDSCVTVGGEEGDAGKPALAPFLRAGYSRKSLPRCVGDKDVTATAVSHERRATAWVGRGQGSYCGRAPGTPTCRQP